MEGLRMSSVSALFCTLLSIAFCASGLFMNGWWINVENNTLTYELFTAVNCDKNLCTLHADTSNGWIIFIQAAVQVQFIMLIVAALFQTVGLVKNKMWLIIAASGALGWSCFSSVLEMCVLSQKYLQLSHGYQTTTIRPVNYVIYQNLPMGLCLISGSLCIPAFVCLVIFRTEERKLRIKQGNQIVQ